MCTIRSPQAINTITKHQYNAQSTNPISLCANCSPNGGSFNLKRTIQIIFFYFLTVNNAQILVTVLPPYREQNFTPKMPKCSLYGRSARIGNKDFLKSRKIRSYYIKGPKTPICTIVIVLSSPFVVLNNLKFKKIAWFQIEREFKACQQNIKFEPKYISGFFKCKG